MMIPLRNPNKLLQDENRKIVIDIIVICVACAGLERLYDIMLTGKAIIEKTLICQNCTHGP